MGNRPAACLEGLELNGGWKVEKVLTRPPTATGSNFSVSYRAVNSKGKEGFLKALDFSKAFGSPDMTRILEAMTKAYNLELDLLNKCQEHRLSKIVFAITHGQAEAPGFVGDSRHVMYLIFELADGDIRNIYNLSKNLDLAWALRSLHNTAVALKQLHSRGIAHQDLKPSNVLFFKEQNEFKVSDLGCASDKSSPSPNDEKPIPGDPGHAPYELLYGYSTTNEFYRRYGIDLYHLGSLIFFYFADISASQAIQAKLKGYSGSASEESSFKNDLPYIRKAFFDAIKELEQNIREKAGDLTDEIVILVKELCEPDPEKRGHPLDRNLNPYNLERYVSKLDLLASKAEYALKK